MNILEVSNFFKPSWETGGVTKINYELSKNLVSRGHKVTVYTTDGYTSMLDVLKNQPVDVDGIEVYYFCNLFRFLVKKAKLPTPYHLPFVLRKQIKNFDIIHIHEHRTIAAAVVHYYAKKHKIPYVVQSHGSILKIGRMYTFKLLFDVVFGYKILRDASRMIAVSNIEINQYVQMGIPAGNIAIIPNGIDTTSIYKLYEKGTFRIKYGIHEKHIILFLGRLNERKGVDFLIKSFAQLRLTIDDVILIIIGSDDGYRSEIENLINKLNINKNVKLIGYISDEDKSAAYLDADILVYPAVNEIFGLVPFEAIMCGTPVIVTDDCGCGDLINNAKCGLLVKYNDVESLKNKMYLLLQDYKLRSNMVKNGQKYIRTQLTFEKSTFKLEQIYEDCLHNI